MRTASAPFRAPRPPLLLAAAAFLSLPAERALGQRVVTVIADDSTIVAPPSFAAGIVAIRFSNKGTSRRGLVVRRLPAGTTAGDLVRGASGRRASWFNEGSFGGPVPGDSAKDGNVLMELRPGRYLLASYAIDQAGRARDDRLIWREASAIPTSVLISGRFPRPDASIRIRDSNIVITGSWRRGARVLHILNAGGLPHELRIGRLKPGKTIDDVKRWNRTGDTPPPVVFVGGVTPLSSGRELQLRLTVQGGEYVVLCRMRDATDRRLHHQDGLLASFRVN